MTKKNEIVLKFTFYENLYRIEEKHFIEKITSAVLGVIVDYEAIEIEDIQELFIKMQSIKDRKYVIEKVKIESSFNSRVFNLSVKKEVR